MVDGTRHSMTEALKGQTPGDASDAGKPDETGPPHPTHDQVAEETRRQQEARPTSRPDRDDLLVNAGRGQQTHG